MTDLDSEKFSNLHELAVLLWTLGCEDVLFLDGLDGLDGDLSQMRSGDEMNMESNQFGSIIVVVKRGGKLRPLI